MTIRVADIRVTIRAGGNVAPPPPPRPRLEDIVDLASIVETYDAFNRQMAEVDAFVDGEQLRAVLRLGADVAAI